MTVTMTQLSLKEARRLVDLLKQHWTNAERTLTEIIHRRAWEPLGYASFPEWWTAEMSEFTLFPELRAHVVYAYFDEGATVADVIDGVKGVGPRLADALKRQRDNRVPAGSATLDSGLRSNNVTVDGYERSRPSEASTLHITVSRVKYKRYKTIARRLGISIEDICRTAIDEKFEQLA